MTAPTATSTNYFEYKTWDVALNKMGSYGVAWQAWAEKDNMSIHVAHETGEGSKGKVRAAILQMIDRLEATREC